MKKLSRLAPRQINSYSWYYVNERTVDVIIDANAKRGYLRIGEKHLRQMLSELRPPRKKRAATKPRKRR